ncbi:MAG: VWA domain-containing protein [Acidobacteriia bacterium]|nr:VWA domain-containing protein [Terriglobia bacterium]
MAGLLASTTWVPVQAQQGGSQEPPPPTIRVNTRVVLVDVVVTDKQGKPVSGLKAADFTVQEKGKAQKIAFFTTPEEAQKQNSPPELGPGIYSNKPEFRSPGGPVTVLLIDAVNTPFRDQAYARLQMLKYVKQQMKPGQRMGVFALTNSLRVLQDFTTDPQVLITALEKYTPQEQQFKAGVVAPVSAALGSTDLSAGGLAMLEFAQSEISAFQAIQVGYQLDRRVEVTLIALRSMARMLAGIPGRKSVVWLTAAFPFELIPEDRSLSEAELMESLPSVKQKSVGATASGSIAATGRQSHSEEIRQVAAELASAQVAIYPVDVRGLMSGMEFLPEDADNRQAVDSSGRAIARMSDAAASQETMREIAAETGGKAYVNQNEISVGVGLAMADDSASYTLGYYPEDKKWDGKYRSIKVKVDRDGTEVRHRRGYFAVDPSQVNGRKPEQEVADALHDMAPDTQVSFSAQVKKTDQGKVGVSFLVDPKTVSATDSSGGKKLNLAVYAAVFSPEGKMLDNASQKVDQVFKEDVYQQILQHGILLHMDLNPQPGKNQLRLAVQDLSTGMVGTINAAMP